MCMFPFITDEKLYKHTQLYTYMYSYMYTQSQTQAHGQQYMQSNYPIDF